MSLSKLLLIFALAHLCYQSNSQTKYKSAGSTNYKILLDDPDNIKPVVFGFNPVIADAWNFNSFMGIGAFIDVNISKYGSVYLDWKKAYFDFVKGIKNHRGIEFGAAYNLWSSKSKQNLQVVLSSELTFSQTRRTQSTTYIVVPGTKKKIIQLRGGLNNYKSGADSYELGLKAFTFNIDTNSKIQSFVSAVKMNFLYAGISWHTINNLVIQHSGNDLATNCNDYNFYFDVMYMPFNMKFSDANGRVRLPNGGYQNMALDIALNDDAEIKKAGWRVGIEAKKCNIRGGFTYRFEFGSKPGFTSNKKGILGLNSFAMVSAGFTFPAGKKYKPQVD
jgi:hypothetical protein